MKRQYLPALRGIFGDWVYYSCIMPMSEVVNRVSFAKDIHDSQKLSDMIQRELKEGRSQEIAAYLQKEEQRFFNSLVVALYGGNPSWHGFENFRPLQEDIDLKDVPSDVENSIGFLSFSGEEEIFALDGQHRLAGMIKAIKANKQLGEDEVPIILVAHQKSQEGKRRTRKLFTTLNKTANPVGKGEIIALDESDVMAIVTRHLIENHEFFRENRIRFVQQSNLPPKNTTELTTIGNLYDVLTIVFSKIKEEKDLNTLKFFRPNDQELEDYINFADLFFRRLAGNFSPLAEYFSTENGSEVIKKYRHQDGGHLLFRPVGLLIISEVISVLVKQNFSLEESINQVKRLPTNLSAEPFADVLWLTRPQKINVSKRVLCRRLLLYMLGQEKRVKELHEKYAKQLNLEVQDCELPTPLM